MSHTERFATADRLSEVLPVPPDRHSEGLPVPREPGYGSKRSQDGEAQRTCREQMPGGHLRTSGDGAWAAPCRVEPMDATRQADQVFAYRVAISARVMHFTLPALPAWPNCTMRSTHTFFIASREGFR